MPVAGRQAGHSGRHFRRGHEADRQQGSIRLASRALGLARTLIEGGLDLDLDILLKEALAEVPETALFASSSGRSAGDEDSGPDLARNRAPLPGAPHHPSQEGERKGATARRTALREELRDFILDRLRGYYTEQGFTLQQFEAVAAVQPDSLVDFDRRLRAVAAFARQPEAGKLAAANKRVANILRKEGIDAAVAAQSELNVELLHEQAERALAQALDAARKDNVACLDVDVPQRDYAGALTRLAQLQTPVDDFFDAVMVMAEDPALRANRIALLARIKARFDAIAEIALL